MATANDLVFGGSEGSGLAQVFGQAPNPVENFLRARSAVQGMQIRDRQQKMAEREALNKRIDQLYNYKPDEHWDIHAEPIYNKLQQRSTLVRNLQERGMDPDAIRSLPEVQNLEQDIEITAARSRALKEAHKSTIDTIKQSDLVDKRWLQTMTNDYFVNASLDESLDLETGVNIVNSPRAYDKNAIIEQSIKDIKDTFSKEDWGNIQNTGLGQIVRMEGTKARFVLPDGTPGISDELIDHVLDSHNGVSERIRYDIARKLFEERTGTEADDYDDYGEILRIYQDEVKDSPEYAEDVRNEVRRVLERHQQVEFKDQVKNVYKTPASMLTGAGPDGDKWFETMRKTINGRSEDALAQVIGGNVLDAKYTKGGDEIELTIKGSDGYTNTRSIPVGTPEDRRKAYHTLTSLKYGGARQEKMKDFVQSRMDELDEEIGPEWWAPLEGYLESADRNMPGIPFEESKKPTLKTDEELSNEMENLFNAQ